MILIVKDNMVVARTSGVSLAETIQDHPYADLFLTGFSGGKDGARNIVLSELQFPVSYITEKYKAISG